MQNSYTTLLTAQEHQGLIDVMVKATPALALKIQIAALKAVIHIIHHRVEKYARLVTLAMIIALKATQKQTQVVVETSKKQVVIQAALKLK